jgi:hypothetical protein
MPMEKPKEQIYKQMQKKKLHEKKHSLTEQKLLN